MIYSKKSSGELVFLNLKNKTFKSKKIKESQAKGQGGLLDVKVYKGHLYFTLAVKQKGVYTTALAKAKIRKAEIQNYKILFTAKVVSDTGRHFGSRLEIIDDQIYMTIGDRGERKYSQKLNVHNGKILRLDLNGRAVKSNPFYKDKKALKEIYSFGHRNPQGISFRSENDKLYSAEFGPRGGDELNLIEPGKNYGWPIITYGVEYSGEPIGPGRKEGLEQPVAYWTPSISPSGMAFYNQAALKEFEGHLFLANLSSRHIRRLVFDGDRVKSEHKHFQQKGERFRQVRNGPDGYLYFTTDSGKIFKLVKK